MLPRPSGSTIRRFALGLLPFAALTLAAAGCSNSQDNVLGSVTGPATALDTFSGTLTVNGAKTFPFVVQSPGPVSAVVVTLSPDNTQLIGVALGTWNGSSCQIVLSNDTSLQGTTVSGQAAALGNFCVRVYDSTGSLPQVESFVVEV
jgi:hypothetical protein